MRFVHDPSSPPSLSTLLSCVACNDIHFPHSRGAHHCLRPTPCYPPRHLGDFLFPTFADGPVLQETAILFVVSIGQALLRMGHRCRHYYPQRRSRHPLVNVDYRRSDSTGIDANSCSPRSHAAYGTLFSPFCMLKTCIPFHSLLTLIGMVFF